MKNKIKKISLITLLIICSIIMYLLLYKIIDVEVFASIIGSFIAVFGTWFVTDYAAEKEILKLTEKELEQKKLSYREQNKLNASNIYSALIQYVYIVEQLKYEYILYKLDEEAFNSEQQIMVICQITIKFLSKLQEDFFYDEKLSKIISGELEEIKGILNGIHEESIYCELPCENLEGEEIIQKVKHQWVVMEEKTLKNIYNFESSVLEQFGVKRTRSINQLTDLIDRVYFNYKINSLYSNLEFIRMFEELRLYGNLDCLMDYLENKKFYDEFDPNRISTFNENGEWGLKFDWLIEEKQKRNEIVDNKYNTEYGEIILNKSQGCTYSKVELAPEFDNKVFEKKDIYNIIESIMVSSGQEFSTDDYSLNIYYI